MFFSVCVPTYNRVAHIVHTLQSLEKQVFKDFEVIVVDDGSTDDTKEVVKSFSNLNLKYIWKKNGGKHSALNVAFEESKGLFFLVLDSDDCLRKDALLKMFELWNNEKDKESLCGVIGKCSENGKMIGIPFNNRLISYIDFHYGTNGGKYKDCCECVKLDLLKQYRWPENDFCKFVPEAFVYDKIGLHYKLICTNEILEDKTYLPTGITKNKINHFKEHAVGHLFNIVDKIENIFPYAHVKFKFKIVVWWKYWRLVKIDKEKHGPRCKHISVLGAFVWVIKPFLDLVKG